MVRPTIPIRCRSRCSAAPAGGSRATASSLLPSGLRSPTFGSAWLTCSAAGSKASAKAPAPSSFEESGVKNLKRSLIPLLPGLAVLAVLLSSATTHAADNALVAAVKKADIATVRRLIQQGTAVNVAGADGSTALHWAVESDDTEMTRLLLRAGADAKRANRYGITPLQ